jgi:hypothetical protein
MATGPLRVQLELRRGVEPIEGRLIDDHDEVVSFTGWLELMSVLEAARAGPPRRLDPESPSPQSPESGPQQRRVDRPR